MKYTVHIIVPDHSNGMILIDNLKCLVNLNTSRLYTGAEDSFHRKNNSVEKFIPCIVISRCEYERLV